jgi:hypothetical protein
MRIRGLIMAGLVASFAVGVAAPAMADDDWHWRHRREEWREHAWREDEWRRHEWRERAWREHEWRERHKYERQPFAVAPGYGYDAPPPVYAAPGYYR